MNTKKQTTPVQHTGSTLDSFLEEEGIKEEVEVVAISRVLGWLLARDKPR